jgi:hypothetical protein
MRLDHAIFKGPLDPKLEIGEIDVPDGYRSYEAGRALGKKMKSWKVQDGKFPDEIDVGLVSAPWGFDDSPDAERISSGVNSKGPDSIAIGRHGNWFLWGFAGDPGQMTESARRVFVNAVCWMKKFDGLPPIAVRAAKPRDLLAFYLEYLQKSPKMAEADWFKKMLDPEVHKATGLVPDKLAAWRRDHVEWIREEKGIFGADADVKSLGVSNRKLEFFDAVLARLASDEKDETAWRVLRRYVPEPPFVKAADVRAWVDGNRARLFFTDVGGYRWMVDPKK